MAEWHQHSERLWASTQFRSLFVVRHVNYADDYLRSSIKFACSVTPSPTRSVRSLLACIFRIAHVRRRPERDGDSDRSRAVCCIGRGAQCIGILVSRPNTASASRPNGELMENKLTNDN